jgi:hypothetical protein
MAFSSVPLLMRDKNMGVVYGVFAGRIGIENTTFGGYKITFGFNKVDFPREIDIDA